jgi:hypothetical protein
MFANSKKFLMLSGLSRAGKQELGQTQASQTQRSQAARSQTERSRSFWRISTQKTGTGRMGDTAALERVRLAMAGAMQASLAGPAHQGASGFGTGLGSDEGAASQAVLSGTEAYVDAQVDVLQRQLQSAQDLDTLWYLRPGLMNVIAVRQGEVAARDCLVALTALFKHHKAAGRSAHSRAH